ncbi:Increased rDNA silencing protein [Rhinocladiella similis]
MTEKQARRPPVAPKPSFIQQDASPLRVSPVPSPAVRGATLAFAPTSAKASNATSHNPAAGALLAASLAASKKPQPPQPSKEAKPPRQNVPSAQALLSSPRGRALTTSKVPVAAGELPSTHPPPPSAFKPHLPRSTSAVAAAAASATASARTSPVRIPGTRKSSVYLGPPELRQEGRPRARSTASNNDSVLSVSQSSDALAGAAAASMAVATTHTQGGFDDRDRPRNHLGSIPRLTLPSSEASMTSSTSPSVTAAAVTASKNAESMEGRRRGQSASSRNVQLDTGSSAYTSTDPSWPQFKLSPPESESDYDDAQQEIESSYGVLPAPVPLRSNRAAMIAHETASSSQGSPVLDARTRMTASSLADAMVASSLASQLTGSRNASPKSRPPPPIPRRRSKSIGPVENVRHHLHFPHLRSETPPPPKPLKPLPVRPMRQTLRTQSSDHGDVNKEVLHKRGRGHWTRHPNKHHEGDRKRWRDKIMERERKRYEGVWAANRGILLELDPELAASGYNTDTTPISDLVVNVVVRDIWDRSRLPQDVLEEVWDLVARPGAKVLNREEFVVGLWLIDQRLKGRKLPIKVSPSVWSSVRHPQGVKISNRALQK